MMKGPEALTAERAQRKAESEGRTVTLRDDSPPQLQQMRRVLRGIWWAYHTRQLDLLELCTANDRQWKVARDQSLKLINEGEEVMVKALFSMFGLPAPADARPAKGERKDKE